jgi:hypothetical protein
MQYIVIVKTTNELIRKEQLKNNILVKIKNIHHELDEVRKLFEELN